MKRREIRKKWGLTEERIKKDKQRMLDDPTSEEYMVRYAVREELAGADKSLIYARFDKTVLRSAQVQ